MKTEKKQQKLNKTNKQLEVTIKYRVSPEYAGDENITQALELLRGVGEAEVVDIDICEETL